MLCPSASQQAIDTAGDLRQAEPDDDRKKPDEIVEGFHTAFLSGTRGKR
jgi:hypothetical protein